MGKGIIQLPVETGLHQLNWYVGRSEVNTTNDVNPTLQVRINNDADFVAKRMWLFQWPNITTSDGTLPPDTSVIFRDGGTNRGLALALGFNRAIANDLAVSRATAAYLGLPSPFLIRRKNNLFVEISRPSAAGTAWTGDIFCALEGYKIFPGQAEPVPRTIRQYAIPFSLTGNQNITDPSLVSGANAQNQLLVITNNGEGKAIVKGFQWQAVDAGNNDVTDALRRALGFQFTDTTSGNREWINNQTANTLATLCPAAVLDMHGTFLPFNTPRYIDPNGSIKVEFLFDNSVAGLAFLGGAATWPVTFTINFITALLPR